IVAHALGGDVFGVLTVIHQFFRRLGQSRRGRETEHRGKKKNTSHDRHPLAEVYISGCDAIPQFDSGHCSLTGAEDAPAPKTFSTPLPYVSLWSEQAMNYSSDSLLRARVCEAAQEHFCLRFEDGDECDAAPAGALRWSAELPAVGD